MAESFFISYSWYNSKIVNDIDSHFSLYHINLIRDVRDLEFKQSIKEFMKQIKHNDYVFMLISKEYLQSKNCLYEVLEFIKNDDYKKRIIPIIFKSADIFSPEGKLKYLSYWNNKYDELEKQLKTFKPEECIAIYQELKVYSSIKNELMEFLGIISDLNSVVIDDSAESISEENYKKIFNYLSISTYPTKKMVLKIEADSKNKDKLNAIDSFISSNLNYFSSYQEYETNHSSRKTFLIDVNATILDDIIYQVLEDFTKNNNLKIIQYFDYEYSYYILSMRKTWQKKSPNALWWAPFGEGYSEDLHESGIFSKEEVEDALQLHSAYPNYEVLGIQKLQYEALINLPIIPFNESYFQKIEQLEGSVIGHFDWEKKSFYHCHDDDEY